MHNRGHMKKETNFKPQHRNTFHAFLIKNELHARSQQLCIEKPIANT